ncbi:hypothetical protein FXO38_21690 [Capsicum annuum]|nr:hypothetical protein FXO38_21690 [Capsicum annuum]
MEACVTPYPEIINSDRVSGGELKPFVERVNAIPPRIASGYLPGVFVESFQEDNKLWKKHVKARTYRNAKFLRLFKKCLQICV